MATAKRPKLKIPKQLAVVADLYFTRRNERLAAEKIAAEIEEEERELREYLIDNLPKSQAGGIAGKLARVSVYTDPVPVVKDWDKFYGYIKKTGDFSLLGKAISKKAIEELWAAKKKVPGVETFKAVKLSLNKL